ncbi:MAG: SCP2 sterol-binding domain-containing protein [Anaerolineae bacterium]|nr:SCP2 sterol-binding domain-containing protein [Anaerolineae bacterium]
MTIFADEALFITVMQALFTRMAAEDPQAADGLLKAKVCVQLRCSDPAAVMMFDGKKRPLSISYSANGIKPDLDVEVTCDALHYILLGELRLSKAVGSKQLKPNGPVWKVTPLADLFHQAQKIYPDVARQYGVL